MITFKKYVVVCCFFLSAFASNGIAATYYMSVSGSDGGNGLSESTAWATFGHAWGVLNPGDTLILLDGIYHQSMNVGVSGTPGNPVTIKAKNDGKATIEGDYTRSPVNIGVGREYLVIEGLIARDSSGTVYSIQGINNIIRRCSGYNANTDNNTHVFMVWTSGQEGPVLLEDCVAGGSGRKMIFAYFSANVTFRRCFAAWGEWRGVAFCVGWGSGHWPWGDAMEFYNTANPPSSDNTMENCIVYGKAAQWGFSLNPNDALAQRNKFLGCMAIKVGMNYDGTSMVWQCPPPNVCPCTNFNDPAERAGFNVYHQYIRDCVWQDCFAWGCGGAAFHTITGPYDSTNTGNKLIRATFKNCGIGTPVNSDGLGTEVAQDALDRFSEVTDCSIENVKGGPAHNGGGARIMRRYVDGTLTAAPLWPWPMEQRIKDELGIAVTDEITGLLGYAPLTAPSKLTLLASPAAVFADGSSTSRIDARILDASDRLVIYSSQTITFRISNGLGSFQGSSSAQAVDGVAAVNYVSGVYAGTAVITATAPGLAQGIVSVEIINNNPPDGPLNLLCDGYVNPAGLSDFTPELSWIFRDSDAGDTQSACRLLVADTQANINNNNGNMWDTGRVTGSAGDIKYSGSPLEAGGTYYWKVMAWDNKNMAGEYSVVSIFIMTRTAPSEFAVEFDGSNDRISMGNTNTLNISSLNASGITIEAWIKPSNLSNRTVLQRYIWNQGGYMLYLDGNLYFNWARQGETALVGGAATKVYQDTWTYIAAQVDRASGEARIYINGQLKASRANSFMPAQINNGFFAGYDGWGGQGSFSGVIDEARISRIARYQGDFTPSTAPFVSDSNTVALWHFNEGSGVSTADISNNISGSLVNGPSWVMGYFYKAETPVSQPTIAVTRPNGREIWAQGQSQAVTWSSAGGVGNVNIDFSGDGGLSWSPLVYSIANDGDQAAVIPNIISASCRIRVQEADGSPGDMSDNNFTVQAVLPPRILVSTGVLDFGEIDAGAKKELLIDITNTGGGLLTGTVTDTCNWLVINPGSFSIGAGGSMEITVAADNDKFSERSGQFSGKLVIDSNGNSGLPLEIPVEFSATCVLVRPSPAKAGQEITFFGSGIVPGNTSIRIYSLAGELIDVVRSPWSVDSLPTIDYRLNANMSPGIYIYVYESPKERGVGKFTVIK